MLLDAGCVPPGAGRRGTAQVETVAVDAPATRTTVTGVRAPQADEQTIRPDAKLLFVAGAGWTKKQADGAVHVAEAERADSRLPARAKASLGGSKSLVDQGGEGEAVLPFMTHMNQIGQTGSTPRHRQGPLHLLPRRGAARGGLALHRRAPRHQSRRQLRLGARQGRRALCRRRVRGDAELRTMFWPTRFTYSAMIGSSTILAWRSTSVANCLPSAISFSSE
jgi:hypothetical protein